jgi:hypothetical protein
MFQDGPGPSTLLRSPQCEKHISDAVQSTENEVRRSLMISRPYRYLKRDPSPGLAGWGQIGKRNGNRPNKQSWLLRLDTINVRRTGTRGLHHHARSCTLPRTENVLLWNFCVMSSQHDPEGTSWRLLQPIGIINYSVIRMGMKDDGGAGRVGNRSSVGARSCHALASAMFPKTAPTQERDIDPRR